MGKKQNRYKEPEEPVVKESRTSSKKERKEKAGGTIEFRLFRKVRAFFEDERVRKISGGFFLLLSFYLLIAFTSFLFTWKLDQDKVDGVSSLSFLFSGSELRVENWLGKLGALLSHGLIHYGFGIASFLFVPLLFVLGFRNLTGAWLLPIGKTLKVSFLILILTSVTFGFIFQRGNLVYLGGVFGNEVNNWLTAALGRPGTLLMILFSYFLVVVVYFNPVFRLGSKSGEEETSSSLSEEETGVNVINPIREEQVLKETKREAIDLTEKKENDILSEQEELEEELSVESTNLSEKIEEESSDNLVVEGLSEQDELEIEQPEEEVLVSDQSYQSEKLEIEPVTEGDELDEAQIKARLDELGEYDPKLDLSSYTLPSLELLEAYGGNKIEINKEELENNKNRILETLRHYNIEIAKIKATIGPTVTLYEIIPAPGVRISKIKNLEDDIALSLAALGIRIIAPIPGKGTIGIEVPNSNPEVVSMRSLIASEKFQKADMELPVVLGKTISNETYVTDLAKMPHLLMAGATGQGKSVGLNAILVSILYKKHPAQVKFVLVDPKKVELTLFNKIERHFLAKLPDSEEAIITENKKVIHTLNSLCIEMDDRYELLKDAQVRNIKEYNAKFISRRLNPENGHKFLPYIVVVVDEFADLIMTAGKEVETPIARLAQLARAIGIHLIIATQRPSVNIITGTIKANFPARIAFRVTSKIDSRTILDAGGAEQLIGRGDMLFSTGNDLVRIQCGFVDTPEVEKITDYIGSQRAYPSAFLLPEYVEEGEESGGGFDDGEDRDELFEDAARIVVSTQQGSASMLQRKLKLGYNRAGRIIDQLEHAGVIGPFKGSKAREVLIKDMMILEQFLNDLNNKNQNIQ